MRPFASFGSFWFFSWTQAYLTAVLAFPVGGAFDAVGDGVPVLGVAFSVNWHCANGLSGLTLTVYICTVTCRLSVDGNWFYICVLFGLDYLPCQLYLSALCGDFSIRLSSLIVGFTVLINT